MVVDGPEGMGMDDVWWMGGGGRGDGAGDVWTGRRPEGRDDR